MKTTTLSLLALAILATQCLLAETDAELEATGRHRVRAGETLIGLARRAGMTTNLFYEINGQACDWGGPAKLRAGEIVTMRNPNEYGKVTPAKMFGGRYSVHEYCFRGRGEPHVKQDDGTSPYGRTGADIGCGWQIAWPEASCGLSGAGLKRLRQQVIKHCFGANFYVAEHWKAPKTLEAVEKEFRDRAWRLVDCKRDGWPTNELHECSHWSFSADSELTWPFGMEGCGEEWYERPVVCFKNEGYSNDGGNGCHSYVTAFVYSIPECKELDERDYFRKDRVKELFELILDRLFKDNNLTIEDTLEKDRSKIELGPGMLCWNVSEKGATWWVNAYHIFPGCCGVTHVTIPWKDLYGFLRDPKKRTRLR